MSAFGDAVARLGNTPPYVVITPTVGSAKPLRLLLGATPSVPAADGGWSIVTRPKNSGFTAWEGYGPHQMNLGVMLDGVAKDVSQEQDYDSLRRIMRTVVGVAKQPSPVRLSGPVPMTDLRWVIQSIEQDPASIIRSELTGELLRVAVTLNLIEYVEADVLVSTASPATVVNLQNAAAGIGQKLYTVKDGDTLSKIAAAELGSFTKFPDIAKLNNIRDLNRVAAGTQLRLP